MGDLLFNNIDSCITANRKPAQETANNDKLKANCNNMMMRVKYNSSGFMELPTTYISNNSSSSTNQNDQNMSNVFDENAAYTFNQISDNYDDFHKEEKVHNKPNCCHYGCNLMHFKLHNLPNRKSVCFDTKTYFNSNKPADTGIDVDDLRLKYSEEVESLRNRLRLLTEKSLQQDNGILRLKQETMAVNSLLTTNGKEKGLQTVASKIALKTNRCRRVNSCCYSNSRRFRRGGLLTSPRPPSPFNNTPVKVNSSSTNTGSNESESIDNVEEIENDSSEEESEEDNEDEESSAAAATVENEEKALVLTKHSNSASLNTTDSSSKLKKWPIRYSLFAHIPPYIKFTSHDTEQPVQMPYGRKYFKWKLSTITPLLVRKTLTNSGFILVRKSNQWLGTWGKHMKSPQFKSLKETQKLNHFPGTFQLGRKDKLWRNFQRFICKFGYKEFGFLPHTYILPQELKLLKQNWDSKNGSSSGSGDSSNNMWIIKPPASARGVGIKVINKWSQLPKKTAIIVQKYISNPYLINGSKFDLRLYVLVTSFNPLRIYLYPEGLARFASSKYSDNAKDLKDRYMHLTNYSINKLSSHYTANEDANAAQGHKWTLSKLMEFLSNTRGVDTKSLWRTLQQLVIKTMIVAEAPITQLCMENMPNNYTCYELFGVDVLLDENLKAWLLEVNISPSLHSASPLDACVKGPLIQTLFDLAQFHFPNKLSLLSTATNHTNIESMPTAYDPKLYAKGLLKKERCKHKYFEEFECRSDYLDDILEELTGDDVRQLTRAEDELIAKGRFERIFPTAQTYKYLQYLESGHYIGSPRYYNRLFDAWEHKYGHNRSQGIKLLQRLCEKKVHLKVASSSSSIKKNGLNMNHASEDGSLHHPSTIIKTSQ